MTAKKYPIGTKVIFIAKPDYGRIAKDDSGKIATIVSNYDGYVDIFIPDSKNNSYISSRKPHITWCVSCDAIKLLKGKQLEFSFMYE